MASTLSSSRCWHQMLLSDWSRKRHSSGRRTQTCCLLAPGQRRCEIVGIRYSVRFLQRAQEIARASRNRSLSRISRRRVYNSLCHPRRSPATGASVGTPHLHCQEDPRPETACRCGCRRVQRHRLGALRCYRRQGLWTDTHRSASSTVLFPTPFTPTIRLKPVSNLNSAFSIARRWAKLSYGDDHATLSTWIWPVTAAAISAERRSLSRAMVRWVAEDSLAQTFRLTIDDLYNLFLFVHWRQRNLDSKKHPALSQGSSYFHLCQ